MRVVLDTNIIISACLKPEGLEARTVELAQKKAFTLCVSREVWDEYCDVLSRGKFRSIHQYAQKLLARLYKCASFIGPTAPLQVASDEDDNRLLECAAAASASYLVTGNLKHFPASWDGARIVNAREFLAAEFASGLPEC